MVIGIAAVDNNDGIGKNGKIPWNMSHDMAWFKFATTNHNIFMGRKSYDEIGTPLPNRNMFILTRSEILLSKGTIYDVEKNATRKYITERKMLQRLSENTLSLICGGQELYDMTLPYMSEIWLSRIDNAFDCDRYFPSRYRTFFKNAVQLEMDGFTLEKWVRD